MKTTRVLLLDADPVDPQLLRTLLEESAVECLFEPSPELALRALAERGPDGFDALLVDGDAFPEAVWPLFEAQRDIQGEATVVVTSSAPPFFERLCTHEPADSDGDTLQRVFEVARRAHSSRRLRFGDLEIDTERRVVRRGARLLLLSPLELDLLRLLVEAAGRPLSGEELFAGVWGLDELGDSDALVLLVQRLRGKIDELGEDSLVEEVPGEGYRLVAQEGPEAERFHELPRPGAA